MFNPLTQEYLRSIFTFDKESNWLFWKYNPDRPANWNAKYPGQPAGSFVDGYIKIGIFNVKYLAHRLIWIYLYGYDPIGLDHKDGDGCNNDPDNLREATQAQNIANADFGQYRGIEKHGRKFRVRIWVEKQRLSIGSYGTLEEAKVVADMAYTQHYGEFAFCNRISQ